MTKYQEKLYDLFNDEQAKYSYYTIGLVAGMMAYTINLILNHKEFLILPFTSLVIMSISLFTGIYFLRYRVSNYYNSLNLDIKVYDKHMSKSEAIEILEKNSKGQNRFYLYHWRTMILSIIPLFIWILYTQYKYLF